jgi:hypothetical protein
MSQPTKASGAINLHRFGQEGIEPPALDRDRSEAAEDSA